MSIRLALETDIESIIDFDHVAEAEDARRSHIARAVEAETVWVFVSEEQILGFVILEYTFFGCGFVALLLTHPDHRRLGVGTALMQYAESVCNTEKLFTSTNESNRAMHLLLDSCNYVRSGVIHNLDEGDPEIVYFKAIAKNPVLSA